MTIEEKPNNIERERQSNNQTILFCKLAYMDYYDGDILNDIPRHGGKYVDENKDALEKNNFHVCKDGYCRGFVETKYSDGYKLAKKPKQIHIENLDRDFRKSNYIPGVTVVFFAQSDEKKAHVIVGWYKDATVYRNRQDYNGRQFNIIAKAKNCTLIKDRQFIVPNSRKEGFGFGQSNLWYAKKEEAQEYIQTVREYISNNTSYVTDYSKIEEQLLSESGIATKVTVNKYERNPNARRICIEKNGAICAACGFDAADIYGEEFKGKIEVHHIIPIHTVTADYKINPVTDLIPLCPNCHMIIHTKVNDTYLSIEELKQRLS